jgi:hypothetical protein
METVFWKKQRQGLDRFAFIEASAVGYVRPSYVLIDDPQLHAKDILELSLANLVCEPAG